MRLGQSQQQFIQFDAPSRMGGTTQWPGLPICMCMCVVIVDMRWTLDVLTKEAVRKQMTCQAVLRPDGVLRGVRPALPLQPAQVRLGGLLQGFVDIQRQFRYTKPRFNIS